MVDLGDLVGFLCTESTEPGAQRGQAKGTKECPAPVLQEA